jgi:two-component system chemotaxis response regulator CheB
MRVLIVDDSVVFRSQIKAALEGSALIEVVGTATNGKTALQKLTQTSGVDLITLDMEMPEMSGLETIKEIKKAGFPVKIIVFSSATTRGSEATLDALEAGADDFVAKPGGEGATFENASIRIRDELMPKILQFKKMGIANTTVATTPNTSTGIHSIKPEAPKVAKKNLDLFIPSIIVIGSSTGGPPALEQVLSGMKLPLRIPIVIAQHMPAMFTASLAKRLKTVTGIESAEAVDREPVKPNHIYVAPGNFHLSFQRINGTTCFKIDQSPPRNSVRPSVDTLFESAADHYGSRSMAIVLTGMGEDGMIGSRAIKKAAGGIMIQNKESCVVFGMPGSVFNAGLQDGIGNLHQIQAMIRKMSS